MMRKIILLLSLAIAFSCGKQNDSENILKAKNKTIDSLKTELNDCKEQAEIMSEVMEIERIDLQSKKREATR